MEEKYLLSSNTYEDWRNYLIVNSFFFDVLMKNLRSKLGLPKEGLKDVMQTIEWDGNKLAEVRNKLVKKSKGHKSGTRIVKEMFGIEDAVRHEAYQPIWDTLEKFSDLNLSFPLLHAFVLGLTNMSFPGSSRVLMITSPVDPIRETGIYIKYSPELSEKEMAVLMKQANEGYQTLFNITHKSERTHDKFGKPYIKKSILKVRQRKMNKPTADQLSMYKAIEDYLKHKYSNHPDSIKIETVFVEVSDKLKVNPGTLKRSYYALLRNFQLPTSVDTKNIFKPTTR